MSVSLEFQRKGCISQGPKPPAYDPDLEILMTIPLAGLTRVRALAADFRMSVTAMLKVLRMLEREYGVRAADDETVWIPKGRRKAILAECGEYHKKAYGF